MTTTNARCHGNNNTGPPLTPPMIAPTVVCSRQLHTPLPRAAFPPVGVQSSSRYETDMLLLTQALPYQLATMPPGQSYVFRVDRFAYEPAPFVSTTPAAAPRPSCAPGRCRAHPDPAACCSGQPEGCDADCSSGMYVPVHGHKNGLIGAAHGCTMSHTPVFVTKK